MSKKKVLVIGGTGIAGQFITDYLLHYHDICELFIASRGIHKISEKKVKFIKMDIHDTQNIESVIKQFDIIILALGPFSCVGTDIYTICLRNHVICVDINDDYGHSGRVLEIKNENITNFRGTIFTGMGLCPGLTTFMLEYAAEQLKKTVLEAELRIYFGAGVVSGTASIINMFEGFKDDLMLLSEREIRRIKPTKYHSDRTFTFDRFHSNMPLIFFSSPEIRTIQRASRFEELQNFDCAFHLQNLPMGIVPLLRKSSFIRKLICKMVNKQQGQLEKNEKNEKSVIVCTYVRNQNSIFRNVSFGYNDKYILHDISVTMKQGSLTAIVGPSGSGKSTLMKLCARFYDPDKGVILLGNKNIREIDPEKLMQRISMVFQDVYLFQDTIKNNIRFGKENATDNEIIEAAKKAQCHDFIIHLPQGYDTMIGEGGCTLSGGEKQRISIARAILKDAPVILLDEATASLDPENEVEIQYAINSLIQGRTVIVIAHKLKTISDADKIIVLDGGNIIEQGTHEQLLKDEGLYAHLWDIQEKSCNWKVNV